MPLTVEIDANSGFCGGVIRAIGNAEDFLGKNPERKMFSLGDIVHNEAELARLREKGLVSIDLEDLSQMVDAHGQTLLIRAHGEPPQTYRRAAELGFTVVDCTCPVVLNLQKSIRQAYEKLHSRGKSGQIVIFGKIGHAEVLGLVGQVDSDAVVVENREQLAALLESGEIRTDVPIEIFSQTTMSPAEYRQVYTLLQSSMSSPELLSIHDTICSQVASRHRQISGFAAAHDVVIFVSGKSSSNGKVLCDLCRSVNIRTYHICGVSDISADWFRNDDRVGVCGATSTPKWLLEDVARSIENLQH